MQECDLSTVPGARRRYGIVRYSTGLAAHAMPTLLNVSGVPMRRTLPRSGARAAGVRTEAATTKIGKQRAAQVAASSRWHALQFGHAVAKLQGVRLLCSYTTIR
jgi:hypothetical protein